MPINIDNDTIIIPEPPSSLPPPLLPSAPPCQRRTLESFISELNPKLAHIAGKIRGIEIDEESDLAEALRWSEAVKERFFQVKAGLNPFQYTMLKVSFEKALR